MTSEGKSVGTVAIGNDHQPICVPGNATIMVLGNLSKLVTKGSYVLKLAVHSNLPSGILVNCSYVTPMARQVILNNTNERKI